MPVSKLLLSFVLLVASENNPPHKVLTTQTFTVYDRRVFSTFRGKAAQVYGSNSNMCETTEDTEKYRIVRKIDIRRGFGLEVFETPWVTLPSGLTVRGYSSLLSLKNDVEGTVEKIPGALESGCRGSIAQVSAGEFIISNANQDIGINKVCFDTLVDLSKFIGKRLGVPVGVAEVKLDARTTRYDVLEVRGGV